MAEQYVRRVERRIGDPLATEPPASGQQAVNDTGSEVYQSVNDAGPEDYQEVSD